MATLPAHSESDKSRPNEDAYVTTISHHGRLCAVIEHIDGVAPSRVLACWLASHGIHEYRATDWELDGSPITPWARIATKPPRQRGRTGPTAK